MKCTSDVARNRTLAILRATAWLALLACLPIDRVGSREGALVLDAAHGGRAGFYFLPPLVAPTPLPPAFDGSLELIARLDGPGGLVATFPLGARPSRGLYEGSIDTSRLGLDPSVIYRVRVLADELELGHADIRVFTTQREARSEATEEYFELVEGKHLKIEVYVNRCAAVTCDAANPCRQAATCDGTTGQCTAGEPLPCTGSVEISAEVSEVAATGAELEVRGAVAIAEADVLDGAPAGLASYWPAPGAPGLAVTLAGSVGAWQQRWSHGACAPLELVQASGEGGDAFADLIVESRGVAELCVYSLGDAHFLEVRLSRVGAALTPTLAALGIPSPRFATRFAARLPRAAFDGQTLDLDVIAGIHGPLPLDGELTVDGGEPWYHARLEGTVSFDFVPTALP